jgi:ectoine hydroxylase-related dioxygenase (phytanoyl-CoA dioxygenase family)
MELLYFCVLIFSFIFISILIKKIYHKYKNNIIEYNLEKDGIKVINQIITDQDIENMTKLINNNKSIDAKYYFINSESVNKQIKYILGDDYQFHDFISIIKKSQFHACHRDHNSILFNTNQKYPSYTLILYLENMDKCLDIIPNSHKDLAAYSINMTDYTESLKCNKGDAFLFDAGLIHSGSLNKKENNLRIQFKISHKDDIQSSLDYFENYNKELNKENKTPFLIKKIQKHISCMFPILNLLSKNFDANKTRYANNNNNFLNKYIYTKLDNISFSN